jgi:hypothetical protein
MSKDRTPTASLQEAIDAFRRLSDDDRHAFFEQLLSWMVPDAGAVLGLMRRLPPEERPVVMLSWIQTLEPDQRAEVTRRIHEKWDEVIVPQARATFQAGRASRNRKPSNAERDERIIDLSRQGKPPGLILRIVREEGWKETTDNAVYGVLKRAKKSGLLPPVEPPRA